MITRNEATLGLPAGSTEIVPNIESAAGLVETRAIAAASPRVTACLLAAEDMAVDLNAERSLEGGNWPMRASASWLNAPPPAWWRSTAPSPSATLRRPRPICAPPAPWATGRRASSTRTRMVAAFTAARAAGAGRAEVDGLFVEVPTFLAAQRQLHRAEELAGFRAASSPDS